MDQVVAMAVTCLVEVPFLLFGFRALGWLGSVTRPALSRRAAVLLAVGVNLLTHPILWLVLTPRTSTPSYPVWLVLAELGVVLVEALIIRVVVRRDLGWAVLLSVGANAVSVLIGVLLGLVGLLG